MPVADRTHHRVQKSPDIQPHPQQCAGLSFFALIHVSVVTTVAQTLNGLTGSSLTECLVMDDPSSLRGEHRPQDIGCHVNHDLPNPSVQHRL